MCQDPSLLIHECTNSSIPERTERGRKGMKVRKGGLEHSLVNRQEMIGGGKPGDKTPSGSSVAKMGCRDSQENEARHLQETAKKEEVRKKALSRGHSTPDEVGKFARAIRARRIVLNHFSVM